MKNVFAAWMWSLRVVARSYRTVVLLAALIALWSFLYYEWLGLPESSALLLILAVVWAIAQIFAALAILGGTVSGAAEAAVTGGRCLPLGSLSIFDRKKFLDTLLFCLVSCALVLLWGVIFGWFDDHAIDVASFLTFHSEKAISHVPIEGIYHVVEWLLWIVLSGFLLSFFIVLLRDGWRRALRRSGTLLARCTFQAPFLTGLFSFIVYGCSAYELANWHPTVPPGFWDYAQMFTRFSLVVILLAAGWLFWLLSLARLGMPNQNPPGQK